MSHPITPHPTIYHNPGFTHQKLSTPFQQPPIQSPFTPKMHPQPQLPRNSSPLDRTLPSKSPLSRRVNHNPHSKSPNKKYDINLNISVNDRKVAGQPMPPKQNIRPVIHRPPSNPFPFVNRFPQPQNRLPQPVKFPPPPLHKAE